MGAQDYTPAEGQARLEIDALLSDAGWTVQDRAAINVYDGFGQAVREFTLKDGHGRVDYLLLVDQMPVGTIEAKPAGTTLTEVELQSLKYITGLPDGYLTNLEDRLPFAYESTGKETRFTNYRHALTKLGREPGMLGAVFRKAQNRIQDPAKLRRLIVDLMDQEQWMILDADVKGDLYEGLLEKNAADLKSGAGQYFTPRALIQAIVEVMRPAPEETINDPACGTGGFLIAGHEWIADNHQLDPDQKKHLRFGALSGNEIVDNTARLCVMNLLLHGIGQPNGNSPIKVEDSLAADPGDRYSMVLTNPPFGKKSSMTIVVDGEATRESLQVVREDFWATTSNKQLNFVQHVKTILQTHGRAAVVVPDNVLFEGGAGETVRRRLLQECDVHTLLRLPTGVFYAQGVKANVLFFDKKPGREEPWTRELWIYDLRTNQHFTLYQNPLTYEALADFIKAYNPDDRHARVESERFHRFTYDELPGPGQGKPRHLLAPRRVPRRHRQPPTPCRHRRRNRRRPRSRPGGVRRDRGSIDERSHHILTR